MQTGRGKREREKGERGWGGRECEGVGRKGRGGNNHDRRAGKGAGLEVNKSIFVIFMVNKKYGKYKKV